MLLDGTCYHALTCTNSGNHKNGGTCSHLKRKMKMWNRLNETIETVYQDITQFTCVNFHNKSWLFNDPITFVGFDWPLIVFLKITQLRSPALQCTQMVQLWLQSFSMKLTVSTCRKTYTLIKDEDSDIKSLLALTDLTRFQYISLVPKWVVHFYQIRKIDHQISSSTESQIIRTFQHWIMWKQWFAHNSHFP